MSAETPAAERDRYRAGLEEIQADRDRNRWHPGTKFPLAGRHWHDGYITALSHHWLVAQKYLDPEAGAEGDRLWRMGSQATDEEWWQETGHCGGCGLVGSSCGCDGKCGCADLHGPRLADWKPAHQLLTKAQAEVDRLSEGRISCARCSTPMLAQDPDNTPDNDALEVCPRCTRAIYTEQTDEVRG